MLVTVLDVFDTMMRLRSVITKEGVIWYFGSEEEVIISNLVSKAGQNNQNLQR